MTHPSLKNALSVVNDNGSVPQEPVQPLPAVELDDDDLKEISGGLNQVDESSCPSYEPD